MKKVLAMPPAADKVQKKSYTKIQVQGFSCCLFSADLATPTGSPNRYSHGNNLRVTYQRNLVNAPINRIKLAANICLAY